MAKIIGTIDLGSNSFYMLISKVLENGTYIKLYTDKHKVQLRSGLSSNGLSLSAQERALDCFHKFKLAMDQYQVQQVIIAGTYSLRKAQCYIQGFIEKSEKILNARINILTGEEEARMVYLGASSYVDAKSKMLVIDIGGGSTEVIIGEGKKIHKLCSLDIGCVGFQEDYFYEGKLKKDIFTQAIKDVSTEVAKYKDDFIHEGWIDCVGASGTIKSISNIAKGMGWSDGNITRKVMDKLYVSLLKKQNMKDITYKGLRKDRENILPGGFCILYGLLVELKIDMIKVSNGALREGLLYDYITS